MNFLNLLSNFLLKPNYNISTILAFLFGVVFNLIFIYFFQTTKNQKYLKLKKIIYININTIVFLCATLIIKSVFSSIIIICFNIISFALLFNESIQKHLINGTIFTVFLFNLLALILKPISLCLNNYNYSELIVIPLFNFAFAICFIINLILTYFIIKKLKINSIQLVKSFKRTIEIFTIFFIDLLLSFEFLYILFNFVNTNNYQILLFFYFTLNYYYFISISNILKILCIEDNKQKITNLELYNKTISTAYDETRTFKHDSNNIFQAIGGYISNNNFDGLKQYYWQLFPEIKNINNLCKLNPTIVNNPAIYGLLAEKQFKASNLNVDINLDVMLDLNSINMKIFEFTRVLGILVDNAIETAKDCSEKIVNIYFKKDNSRQLLIIENTYANKEICIDKIFEKGYSTKPNNTGLGLWEVRKILNKNSNLNLYTSKTNDYFKQQLEIY